MKLIDVCERISSVARSEGLTTTQLHIWSVIVGRLARGKRADTKALIADLDICPRQLSFRISRLVAAGYFHATLNGRGQQDGRTLKATEKTKQLLTKLAA